MEWWQTTIVIAAGVLTLFNLGDKIISWVKEAKKPTDDLEHRVDELERKIDVEYKALFADYEVRFKRDLERLNEMENQNKLMMRAMLELLRHAETGNNTEKLKKVADEVQTYILNK